MTYLSIFATDFPCGTEIPFFSSLSYLSLLKSCFLCLSWGHLSDFQFLSLAEGQINGLLVDSWEVSLLFSAHNPSMFYTCWWMKRGVTLWPVESTEISAGETQS